MRVAPTRKRSCTSANCCSELARIERSAANVSIMHTRNVMPINRTTTHLKIVLITAYPTECDRITSQRGEMQSHQAHRAFVTIHPRPAEADQHNTQCNSQDYKTSGA